MYKITYSQNDRIKTHKCKDFNVLDGFVVALGTKDVWFSQNSVIKIEKL